VIIIASCTLHNYVLQYETDVHDVDIEPDEDVLGIEHDASSTANKAAVQKRDAIALLLFSCTSESSSNSNILATTPWRVADVLFMLLLSKNK